MPDIVLVSMPVVDLERPSLGLSLLAALLSEGGISSTVRYPAFSFAERVGLARYLHLSRGTRSWATHYLADIVFAPVAFPDHALPWDEMLAALCEDPRGREPMRALLVDLQRHARELVYDLAEEIVASRPRGVGCTSTFQQHVASLALLRRVRDLEPRITTLLGGANCETEMGAATHRAFPWVDYVVSGEADGLVVPLCRAILEGREFEATGVRGPAARRRADAGVLGRATFSRLDMLPHPEFADYFEALRSSRVAAAIDVGLPVETSRGCWWGAKHHCTFCGLNGGGMAFRSKSADRAHDEIVALSRRWAVRNVEVVDNILDMRYLDTLIPRLQEVDPLLNLFYEVKSNLTPDQVARLAAAGVRSVQPGIESLDTRVLSLMDKGVRSWQQVLFLKSARQHGVQVSWNILFDFPGEDDAWYLEMAEMGALLAHLQPPSAVTNIRFDRYSPYFEQAERYRLELHPHPLMPLIYPVAPFEASALSYHFTRAGGGELDARPGVRRLLEAVTAWRAAFHGARHAELRAEREGDDVRIRDTRPCASQATVVLTGLDGAVHQACSDAPTLSTLAQRVGADPTASLGRLRDLRLLLVLDGRPLSLAVGADAPAHPYFPPFAGGRVVASRLAARALAPRGAFERLFLLDEALR